MSENIPQGTQVVYQAHVVVEKGEGDSWTCGVLLHEELPVAVYGPEGTTASDSDAATATVVVESFMKIEYPIF